MGNINNFKKFLESYDSDGIYTIIASDESETKLSFESLDQMIHDPDENTMIMFLYEPMTEDHAVILFHNQYQEGIGILEFSYPEDLFTAFYDQVSDIVDKYTGEYHYYPAEHEGQLHRIDKWLKQMVKVVNNIDKGYKDLGFFS